MGKLERVKGIEPSYAAWEAAVLPLNYTRPEEALPDAGGAGQKGDSSQSAGGLAIRRQAWAC